MQRQITGYPLSPQQRRLWNLGKERSAESFAAHAVVRIQGVLQQDVLQRALQHVVDQNEILRTVLQKVPGMLYPLQVVQEEVELHLAWEEAGELSSEEQQQRVETLLEDLQAAQAVRSEQDPILAILLSTAQNNHLLLLSWPAVALDLEMQNLAREVAAAYETLVSGGALTEEENIQYAVAAEVLNEIMESDEAEASRLYWAKQDLSDAVAVGLPVATRSGDGGAFAPKSVTVQVAQATRQGAVALAQRQGTTVDHVLLAAWITLLGRLTAQESVCVDTLFDGRIDEEIAQAIGPYGIYLPLQQSYDGARTFQQILQDVDRAIEEMRELQLGFSWELLAKGGQVTESSHLSFGFDSIECGNIEAGSLSFSLERFDSKLDRFQLRLAARRFPEYLQLDFCYDGAELQAADVENIAASYLQVLAHAVTAPEAAVGSLTMLDEKQRQAILDRFGRVEAPVSEMLLHEMFERQARLTPETIAVTCGDKSLTYAELNARANQTARFLQKSGLRSQAFVGLAMERSLEMVVAMLAVLKAGAAYLPIDPEYPIDRVAYMLENSEAPVVLTQAHLAGNLPEGSARILLLDGADGDAVMSETTVDLGTPASPESPAYVIYTSGSTGRPKGVVIPHRAIVNHMEWMLNEFPLTGQDVVLQKTSFSFDASVWEFYAPLIAGACLVMARPGGHADPEYLIAEVQARGVTTLQLVPSLLAMMTDMPGWAECSSLQRVFCGGEALKPDLVERVHAVLDADVINLYGPTESCIDATFWVCERGTNRASVPIGSVIANVQACVLDEFGELVPFGVAGELYLGGRGLALGYHGLPEMTAEKFIPNRFTPQDSERLYKTGDLVRQFPDGTLEYLGRIDHQVKIRGYRIELAEIEAVLTQHPAVKRAIAVAHADDKGNQRLLAYAVLETGVAAGSEEILRQARHALPEYMVPALLIMMEAFPLTPNGKIDRRALPEPDFTERGQEQAYVAPESEVESLLDEIWSEVLGVERVGSRANFFGLGGHSLLATQIIYRLREQLELDIPLRSIFEAPTIEQLAVMIEDLLLADLEEHSDEQ